MTVSNSQHNPPKTLVLAGAGHAHLLFLDTVTKYFSDSKKSSKAPKPLWPKVKVLLVEPHSEVVYSGMVSGYFHGIYTRNDVTIFLNEYVRSIQSVWNEGGWDLQWIQSKLVSFQQAEKLWVVGSPKEPENHRTDDSMTKVTLSTGSEITCSVLSLNIGARVKSIPSMNTPLHTELSVLPVKPLVPLVQAIEDLNLNRHKGNICILGSGPSGTELALGIAEFLGAKPKFNIYLHSGSLLLPGWRNKSRAKVEKALKQRKVSIVHSCQGLPSPDFVINATGFEPQGSTFCVNEFLHLEGFRNIFAAGDGVFVQGQGAFYGGVYPVRQSAVLISGIGKCLGIQDNSLAAKISRYKHPKKILQIITLGTSDRGFLALARYGMLSIHGAWVFMLKDKIDRAFMKKFKNVE